jgi:pyruvate-formate lyase
MTTIIHLKRRVVLVVEEEKRQTYMASKLTCMTKRSMRDLFIRRQRNMLRKTMIGVMTGVNEATMPNIVRGGGRGESTGLQVLEIIKLPVLLH